MGHGEVFSLCENGTFYTCCTMYSHPPDSHIISVCMAAKNQIVLHYTWYDYIYARKLQWSFADAHLLTCSSQMVHHKCSRPKKAIKSNIFPIYALFSGGWQTVTQTSDFLPNLDSVTLHCKFDQTGQWTSRHHDPCPIDIWYKRTHCWQDPTHC